MFYLFLACQSRGSQTVSLLTNRPAKFIALYQRRIVLLDGGGGNLTRLTFECLSKSVGNRSNGIDACVTLRLYFEWLLHFLTFLSCRLFLQSKTSCVPSGSLHKPNDAQQQPQTNFFFQSITITIWNANQSWRYCSLRTNPATTIRFSLSLYTFLTAKIFLEIGPSSKVWGGLQSSHSNLFIPIKIRTFSVAGYTVQINLREPAQKYTLYNYSNVV